MSLRTSSHFGACTGSVRKRTVETHSGRDEDANKCSVALRKTYADTLSFSMILSYTILGFWKGKRDIESACRVVWHLRITLIAQSHLNRLLGVSSKWRVALQHFTLLDVAIVSLKHPG